jgi:hypothetical protein
MGDNTELIGIRVPPELDERITELAEEDGSRSKSSVVRNLVMQSLDERDASRDSTSPLAIVGVVVSALFPILLVTGHPTEGLAFALLAGLYVPMWVFGLDARVEAWARDTRVQIQNAGGVALLTDALSQDPVVEDPDGPVERLTRADRVGGVAFGVLVVIGAAVGLLLATNLLTPALETLGAGGGVALLAIVVALMYLVWVSYAVSALATIVVARRHAGDASGGETQAAADRGGA